MNLNTLKTFRQQVYDCIESRADALFSLCDGLLSEPQARSLPEQASSWTPPLDLQGMGRDQTAIGVAIDQLRRLC
jgi:hypothetical protein